MSVPKALGIQTSTPTILRSGKKKLFGMMLSHHEITPQAWFPKHHHNDFSKNYIFVGMQQLVQTHWKFKTQSCIKCSHKVKKNKISEHT